MIGYYEASRDNMQRPMAWHTWDNCFCAHFHEGIELVYVLDGEFHALLDGESVTVKADSILINSCYTVHAYEGINSTVYIALIPMNAVPALRKRLTESRFRACTCPDDENHTLRILMSMLAEKHMSDATMQGLCQLLLGMLMDAVGLETVMRESDGGALCRMLSYLEEHFAESVGVDGLAREFGLSRSYISHLIRAGVGMSLPQYVNMLRCRWVAEQMQCSNRAILELALDAGYHNARTFYTAFRSIYGVTPREYVRGKREESVGRV